MVSLLSKLFIKDYKNTESASVRQAYGILCGGVGIFFNLLLFIGKFIAGLLSNSIAITADAFNNLSDAGSSVITLIGFKLAGQKPDPDHPYGHGRIEYISGLFVAVIIILMGVELVKTSFDKIINPEALEFSPIIVVILVTSIIVKFYMTVYNRRIGNSIHSPAMLATATDSISDTFATTVVLISTCVSHFTGLQIDGYFGVLVGIFICYSGIIAAKDTINPLLGQAPDPAFVQQIHDIVMSNEGILDIHDLMVHNYGPGRILISLHAEVPADGDILASHDLIDLIEHQLRDKLHCTAVIHMDPICVNDEETTELKHLIMGYIEDIDLRLTIHDFRIVKGHTHTNIIFDIVTPYNFHISDKELLQLISNKVKAKNPNYYTIIEIDKNYA